MINKENKSSFTEKILSTKNKWSGNMPESNKESSPEILEKEFIPPLNETSDNSLAENLDLTPKLIKLQEEKAELEKKFLYALAEVENLKKQHSQEIENFAARMRKAVEDARNFSVSNLVSGILGFLENLMRALKAIEESQTNNLPVIQKIIEGLNLAINEINNILKQNGVEKIIALDAEFDPQLHEAVKTIADDTSKNGVVKEVLQEGYTIKGRLLRPAAVVVVKNDAS